MNIFVLLYIGCITLYTKLYFHLKNCNVSFGQQFCNINQVIIIGKLSKTINIRPKIERSIATVSLIKICSYTFGLLHIDILLFFTDLKEIKTNFYQNEQILGGGISEIKREKREAHEIERGRREDCVLYLFYPLQS